MDNRGYEIENDIHAGMWKLEEEGDPSRWMAKGESRCETYSNGHIPTKKTEAGNGKKKTKPDMVRISQMFRFASPTDKLLTVLGAVFSMAQGIARPLQILFFGNIIDVFVDDGNVKVLLDKIDWNSTLFVRDEAAQDVGTLGEIAREQNLTSDFIALKDGFDGNMQASISSLAVKLGLTGVAVFFGMCFSTIALYFAAANQAKRLRVALFRSILRQDISWYDTNQIGELNTKLTENVNRFHEGIGDKIGLFFNWTSSFVASLLVAFVLGWKLAIVVLAFVPLLAIGGIIISKVVTAFTERELKAYSKAGAVAEEVLSSIRTVFAFGGQTKECERYGHNLKHAKKFGERVGLITGIGLGFTFATMYGAQATALYWGSKLVWEDQGFSPGRIVTILFCVVVGGTSLGNASPAVPAFAAARAAAHTLWKLVDRVPPIDSSSSEGKRPEKLNGNIELRNIKFRYPARPDVQVMDGLSLSVNVGQTVALVGSSGCGKSTTVQLIQRFYDPDSGSVLLDGIDITELNIKWLRQHIGVVSQEPVLFGTTIEENIRYGRSGVTEAEIEQAAKEANAHDFISKLPLKYETLVGERGAQLSGGQKQRIAIARALVRNPKILLLDEATSALDTESEATVQSALDKARKGRTTIVIAHRLSTVRTADVIIGIENGKVAEQGTHEELMDKKGIYHTLVTNQSTPKEDENSEMLDSKVVATVEHTTIHQRLIQREQSKIESEKGDVHIDDEDSAVDNDVSMLRLMRMNAPEWKEIVVGCLAAMVNGVLYPGFALLLAEILAIFSYPLSEQEDRVNTVGRYYILLIFLAFTAHSLQGTFMGKSGEGLTCRLRNLAFKSYLRQEVAYFDDPKNNIGALTTRLASEAPAVKGATGARLALILQDTVSLCTAVVIGLVYSWMMTLFFLGFIPVILGAALVQTSMLGGMIKEGSTALEDASKVTSEAIANIRTVAALTKEDEFVEWYHEKLRAPAKKSSKGIFKVGLVCGLTQSSMYFMLAACCSMAAFVIAEGHTDFRDVFRVFFAIVMSSLQAGRAASLAPDYKKAKLAAAKIFSVIDRQPAIDNMSEDGTIPKGPSQGRVDFCNVDFNYPTRFTVPVLQGLNLKVDPGQTLALVGSSGCGKSTTIQLLERFYDPLMGSVMIDGNFTSQLNIQWMRSQMGLVSQEPVLFDTSIRENIAYGDNNREVPTGEIIKAARDANIHDFISKLPEGYETNVGDKGTQLSGGQKQRIAIARALVRNPKILLLDEATSALDTESEKVVQEALDRAQQGRTSIVIAHRLSTIQNADCIAVIHHGKVVEKGTHSELMAQQGQYYKLNSTQLHKTNDIPKPEIGVRTLKK